MQGGILPPHVLRALERHEEPDVRYGARRALVEMRALRARPAPSLAARSSRTSITHMHPQARRVFTCGGAEDIPGELLRREGEPPCDDAAANRAFDAAGVVHAFWREVFWRDSLDGHGLHLLGSVHYGRGFDNAFWNGAQMVYGDGDGIVVAGYTSSLDVIAHEMTHAVVQSECALIYEGESGALSESIADVFGSLVKQWNAGQSAGAADWLIGTNVFTDNVAARGLRSLAAPGSAYDDAALGGHDPQVALMRDFVESEHDDGGVHVNSGIPNHAFYLFAGALGGNAWDVAGRVWYDALRSGLERRSGFKAFDGIPSAPRPADGAEAPLSQVQGCAASPRSAK